MFDDAVEGRMETHSIDGFYFASSSSSSTRRKNFGIAFSLAAIVGLALYAGIPHEFKYTPFKLETRTQAGLPYQGAYANKQLKGLASGTLPLRAHEVSSHGPILTNQVYSPLLNEQLYFPFFFSMPDHRHPCF